LVRVEQKLAAAREQFSVQHAVSFNECLEVSFRTGGALAGYIAILEVQQTSNARIRHGTRHRLAIAAQISS